MFQTANKQYNYNTIIHGKPLYEWINLAHENNCKIYGWNCKPLSEGCFGYDNLAMSLMYAFEYINNNLDVIDNININNIASQIHEGWCCNYIFWRDNDILPPRYLPRKSLGDARRNNCAITKFENLPLDEQQKDIVIAEFIKNELSKTAPTHPS